jgi:hypothetical protein
VAGEHDFSISRGKPLRAGEAAERPGHARCRIVACTVSAWAGALRAAGGREPSGRGFLTRSDGGPRRAEGRRTPSGPRGRFQPAPGAFRRSAPRGCSRRPVRTARGPIQDLHAPPTDPKGPSTPAGGRSPLDRPRHPPGRQLDGLPGGGARVIMGVVSSAEDKFGSRFFRALIWRGFGADVPRIDAGLSPRNPSPLAGEGGPKGRVRGRTGLSDRPFNPSSDLAPRGHLLPQGEKGSRARPHQVGPNLTSFGGCSVQPVPSCDRLAGRCKER